MFRAVLLGAVLAAGLDPSALLKSADAPREALLHSIVRVRATVTQAGQPPRTGEFDLYLGNEDQQLVVFRDKHNKGRKFIMNGDKAWLIVPGSAHAIAVTASQRMFGAMSYTDIARVRLSRDYAGTLRTGMEPCGAPAQPCRVLDITATVKTAPYASGTLWIDGEGLLRKAVFALASGKPAKEITYRYTDTPDGRLVPSGLTLIDLLMPDRTATTTLEYLHRQPADLPASTFDPAQQLKR
jgi:hypothetical protein